MHARAFGERMGRLVRARMTEPAFVLALTVAAGVLRLAACLFTLDVPGDGPTRAIAAYEWAVAPTLVTHGVWPPGLVYLSGIVSMVLRDPLWSVRIVNLVAGIATVPLLYVLVRRAFRRDVAVAVASLLAVLPLHLELSASSLAEPTFVLEVLLGTWIVCFLPAPRSWQWVIGLVALLWATMTRYEAWWLAPVLVAASGLVRRRWSVAIAVAAATSVFPVAWTLGNWLVLGDPFYGFRMAQKGAELAGTPPLSLAAALAMLGTLVAAVLGWPAALGVPVTLAAAIARRTRPRGAALVWGAVTLTFWVAMSWFAMRRGSSIVDRYVVFGVVMVLPYALAPWAALARRSFLAAMLVAAVLVAGAFGPRVDRWPLRTTWITWRYPTDVEAFTSWLRLSPYRAGDVLLTSMDWDASYFAAFWPEAAGRRLIVSDWTEDHELRWYLRERRPALLITTDADDRMRRRVEALAGPTVIERAAFRSFGAIEVHRLHHR